MALSWFIYFVILLAAAMTAAAAWKGAPYVPTPKEAIAAALELADVKTGDTLVDIGAGDGRVLVMAAKRGARVIGYELSPFLWLLAFCNLLFHRVKGSLKLRDGFGADLSQTTVLFLFLMPKTLPNLMRELKQKLQPGTRIITYTFPIDGWLAEKEIKLEGVGKIYLYRVA
jgi:SAM-dependent methyltransferase